MTATPMGPVPAVGARVISRDDIELGTVKEVEADCFKIDAPLAADFWLGVAMIETMDGGAIRLAINKLSVEEMKEDAPAHTGIHRHT